MKPVDLTTKMKAALVRLGKGPVAKGRSKHVTLAQVDALVRRGLAIKTVRREKRVWSSPTQMRIAYQDVWTCAITVEGRDALETIA